MAKDNQNLSRIKAAAGDKFSHFISEENALREVLRNVAAISPQHESIARRYYRAIHNIMSRANALTYSELPKNMHDTIAGYAVQVQKGTFDAEKMLADPAFAKLKPLREVVHVSPPPFREWLLQGPPAPALPQSRINAFAPSRQLALPSPETVGQPMITRDAEGLIRYSPAAQIPTKDFDLKARRDYLVRTKYRDGYNRGGHRAIAGMALPVVPELLNMAVDPNYRRMQLNPAQLLTAMDPTLEEWT